MDEWAGEFGSERPESVGSLMREVVDHQMSQRLSANQRAAAAWYRANGDRERNHTTGVFLKRAKVAGAAPVLGVYVDSHAMAVDFGVNKDIYLARLANIGFAVSGVDFVVSREGHRASRKKDVAQQQTAQEMLPELSAQEQLEVESLVADLPESLRTAASRAVENSKRREKQQNH